MQVDPVPSPLRKSPPWHMKLGICLGCKQFSTHTHKGTQGTNDAVELGALVALWPAYIALGFAGAELAEVLSGLGDDVLEELEGDAAEGLA